MSFSLYELLLANLSVSNIIVNQCSLILESSYLRIYFVICLRVIVGFLYLLPMQYSILKMVKIT